MQQYTIGLDLGQVHDYTAVAIMRRRVVPRQDALFAPVGEDPGNRLVEGRTVYDLVSLKRFELGTPYNVIARKVVDRLIKLEPMGEFGEKGRITLAVDGTGVGRGTVDMIRTEMALRRRREYLPEVDFRPVAVTGSDTNLKRPTRADGYWSVPKTELVFPCVAAFQERRMRIAHNLGRKEKDALVHELENYRRKVNIRTGREIYEAWRERDPDDLLFAVCLALWGGAGDTGVGARLSFGSTTPRRPRCAIWGLSPVLTATSGHESHEDGF